MRLVIDSGGSGRCRRCLVFELVNGGVEKIVEASGVLWWKAVGLDADCVVVGGG